MNLDDPALTIEKLQKEVSSLHQQVEGYQLQ